ncbi:MAG: hypothetical protein L3J20_07950 [Flavobacteriaceae bacterium]|nr:hypothetical protein [Flavobacteriaceae bacterium]
MIRIDLKIVVQISILFLIIVSCKRKIEKTEMIIGKQKDTVDKFVDMKNTKIKDFILQDTIYREVYTYGKLKYDMSVDSIEESNIEERVIMLYVSIDKDAKSFEEIKKSRQNIFIDTIGDGTFNFKFMFTDAGENVLSLALDDQIYLKKYPSGDSIEIPNSRIIITSKVNLK